MHLEVVQTSSALLPVVLTVVKIILIIITLNYK